MRVVIVEPTSEVALRWKRVGLLSVVLVFVIVSALFAQKTNAPAPDGPSSITIALFIGTWIGLIMTLVGLLLTLRRDRINMRDRVDARTEEIFGRLTTGKEWTDKRDERIREVGRDLMYREFNISGIVASTEALTARVEALSRRVASIPEEIKTDVKAAVSHGVAEATEKLALSRLKDLVLPDRNRHD